MALRDQPYLPLYVNIFLTDEKLNECSAKSVGVYIKIMCLMHKSEEYGKILLKQKDLIGANIIENYALKFTKHLPFSKTIIEESLRELIDEKVLFLEDDKLCQKRMIRDNELSIIRSEIGSKGGKNRAKNLTKERRSEIAKMGADKRWGIDKKIIPKRNINMLDDKKEIV